MINKSISVVVLAAGNGTRMMSSCPKVLHEIAGRSMLSHVLHLVQKLNPEQVVVVVSDMAGEVADAAKRIYPHVVLAEQKQQLGTAHATLIGLQSWPKLSGSLLVLYADTPLLTEEVVKQMMRELDSSEVVVLGFRQAASNQYGKIVLDERGVVAILEHKDDPNCELELCNSGVVLLHDEHAEKILRAIAPNNAASEFYLTSAVEVAKGLGLRCACVTVPAETAVSVNTKVELAEAERIAQSRLRKKFMDNGVTMIDPSTVFLSADTEIESDAIIYPNVFIGPQVHIGRQTTILSFSHIEGVRISHGASVGPFARIRHGTQIGANVKIGNFVEVKNSNVGDASKISHLSYIGDADLGSAVNVGAGVVTCNYDGVKKSRTTIKSNAFIGSNASLIAPVEIGEEAMIGAGSVIVRSVPAQALGLSRAEQSVFPEKSKVRRS